MKNQLFILIIIFFAGFTSCQKEIILPASQDNLNTPVTTRSGKACNGGNGINDIIDDNVTDPNEDEDFDKDKKNIGG